MNILTITPVSYDEGTALTAARILATCDDAVTVTNGILRKAGVNSVGDLRTFEMRDAFRQKGVGPIKLFNAMLEAAAQNGVGVDTLAHPLGLIPTLPEDALRQALHAGLVLLRDGRKGRIAEPVLENGIIVDTVDSDRARAYNGGKDGRRTAGFSVTQSDFARRIYRRAVAVEGIDAITLTAKGRLETTGRYGKISWIMPTPMAADDNRVTYAWGVDRETAMASVAAPAVIGGKDRDSLKTYVSPPVLADEQAIMVKDLRDMGVQHPYWLGAPLVGTSYDEVIEKMQSRPVLTCGVVKGVKTWRHPSFKRSPITDIQVQQLLRADWLESDGGDGVRATARLRRAFVASLCQPGIHRFESDYRGYVIADAPAFDDGQQLVLWFDAHGCIRIETTLPVTMSERAAMRQDIAEEADTTVEQIRYDLGTAFRGMIIPHCSSYSYLKDEIAACPSTWRQATDDKTVNEIIRAEVVRASFADLLEQFGAPINPAVRTSGCMTEAPEPTPAVEADADAVARELAAPRGTPADPVRRTRLMVDEIQSIVASHMTALVRIGSDEVRVRRVDDVDHSAGVIVVQAERQDRRYTSSHLRNIRMMIDVHAIDSVAMD